MLMKAMLGRTVVVLLMVKAFFVAAVMREPVSEWPPPVTRPLPLKLPRVWEPEAFEPY
jgi:hypothetical protein